MKRVISLLFVAAMFFSLVACNNATTENKEAEVTTPETEIVEQTPTQEPEVIETEVTEVEQVEEVTE